MITWYLTRGVGAAALLLLTGSVALGVVDVARFRSPRYPRFVIDDVHRSISLAALVLVVVHVIVSVLDTFAPVRLTDAVVPFAGSYRPVWLGLGALSLDLMLVLVVSSLLRPRIGARIWRAIHWLAWACWPVALVHSFGTGSDVKRGWMLALGMGCTAIVALAVGVRVMRLRGRAALRARALAAGTVVAGAIALAIWLPAGPLGHGWALRAGTPVALLHPKQASFTLPAAKAAPPVKARREVAVQAAFAAQAGGTVRNGVDNRGATLVDIRLAIPAQARVLDIRLAGAAAPGGGVRMTRSQVTLGPRWDPARYVGRLTALDGTRLSARLTPLRGRALVLNADLALDAASGQARGQVAVRPTG